MRPVALVLLFACAVAAQQSIGLKPFSIDHRAADGSVIDLSWMKEKPAGKGGWSGVQSAVGGHPELRRSDFG
jgi:hypothetical protein